MDTEHSSRTERARGPKGFQLCLHSRARHGDRAPKAARHPGLAQNTPRLRLSSSSSQVQYELASPPERIKLGPSFTRPNRPEFSDTHLIYREIFPFWDHLNKLGGSGPSSRAHSSPKTSPDAAPKQAFEALFKRVLMGASPLRSQMAWPRPSGPM